MKRTGRRRLQGFLVAAGLGALLARTTMAALAAAPTPRPTATPSPQAQAPEGPNLDILRREWERFTREPHPMGTQAQFSYANHLVARLRAAGLETRKHTFTAKAPNLAHPALGGREGAGAKAGGKTKDVKGVNVQATRKGSEPCAVLLAGHYDTKAFPGERFVGANDGGSSTVSLLELARLLGKERAGRAGTYAACDLHFLFFDGEEAFLKEWDDGERLAGVKDNLYGSRAFVESRLETRKEGRPGLDGKPVTLLALFDMIGHKNQKIFLTQGSHPGASAQLIALKGLGQGVDLSAVPLGIEDDHIPFARRGVPFVHLIDWTNLAEWHTPRDTLDIVSAEKVAALLVVVKAFLQEQRALP